MNTVWIRTLALIAIKAKPFLKGLTAFVPVRVPSGKMRKFPPRLEFLHAVPDERGSLVVGNEPLRGEACRPPEKRALNEIRRA